MKNKEFKKLSETEKKAILCAMIAKKTKGKISKEDITFIVNSLDIDYQYTIKVITDAKEFAKEITMIESGFSHSWAGSYGKKEIPLKWFWWDVEPVFGLNRNWYYSDNGQMREPDIVLNEPNFNITGIYCIIKEVHEWNNYNNSDAYDKHKYYMIFYIPESEPYKIDDKLKAIIEEFCIE